MIKTITILGPTATGKTKLAVALADQINGEIISIDSRQVYKQMDIGTGKDIEEYKNIPYHLIDIKNPGSKYTLNQFQNDFYSALQKIKKIPILCGGTGLYLEAILNRYNNTQIPVDEALRNSLSNKNNNKLSHIFKKLNINDLKFDISTKKRIIRAIEILSSKNDNIPNFPSVQTTAFGIKIDIETRRKNITNRLHERLEKGMIDEVESLLNNGISPENLIYYGLEYKYITLYLTNKLSKNEMITKLNTEIHRFAKRQMTWYRRMERNGLHINWIDYKLPISNKIDIILTKIN